MTENSLRLTDDPLCGGGFTTGESGEEGTVTAAHLQSRAPKVHKSEYDMDVDAYHNERARGTDFGKWNVLGDTRAGPLHKGALSNHPARPVGGDLQDTVHPLCCMEKSAPVQGIKACGNP